jgi:hypothetical protein
VRVRHDARGMSTCSTDGHSSIDVFGCPGRHVDRSFRLPSFLAVCTRRAVRRRWPIFATVLMLVFGILFMLFWLPVVEHLPGWYTGDDSWGVFRGAHYVGWGYLGGIYVPSNGVITFPGISIVLAPLAMLSGALHLSESYPPIVLVHPTAALLLEPAELLLASSVVFACDALAECLQSSSRRRMFLCLLVGTIAWPTVALWGHAEDALAMTFTIYAMVMMLKGNWRACGWLLGLGLVMQPLVGLALPLFIAAVPSGKRFAMSIRSVALSAVVVAVAFAGNAGDTYRALIQQPEVPTPNHPTPWLALSPKLATFPGLTVMRVRSVLQNGHSSFGLTSSYVHSGELVVGGPSRSIYMLLAVLLGLYVWRRPQDPIRLLWLVAVALAARCFFEAVMTPYYLAPPLFLALALTSRHDARRFGAAALLGLEITVFSYHHLSPWVWWLPVVAGLTAILALAYPNQARTEPASVQSGSAHGESSELLGEARLQVALSSAAGTDRRQPQLIP